MAVHEQCSVFCFGSGSSDYGNLHAVGMDGAIDSHRIIAIAEEVKAASDGGAVRAREVRAVRVSVQHHVTRCEDQGGVAVRRGVGEQTGRVGKDGVCCVGLCRRECADAGEVRAVEGAAIVEETADDLL